ncbi:MAG: crotonase/enoyl-CoA hydratase family protein [Halioglobus sp.]|nr:crotonase/enoyl-CoA hydratase family protein [Halioglobus sp.]
MNYENVENTVTLTFDDGKANVVNHSFLDEINSGLDRAQKEDAGAVILRGREGIFSGGFDLREFEKGAEQGTKMVRRGFELLVRLYSFPLPLVAACTGHGIAMGAFIIMACDWRIGSRGEFKMSLPETRLGMDLPSILVALTASRVTPRHLNRVTLLSEIYAPEEAVSAGFLDEVVEAGDLESRSRTVAGQLAELPGQQFAKNKLSVRAETLKIMRSSLESFG